jgi:glycosyltransferase involved in cell wall biosynthesis
MTDSGRKIRVLLAIGEMSGGGSQRQMLEILRRLDRGRFEPRLYVLSRGGELMGDVPGDVPVHVFQDRQPPRWWNSPRLPSRGRLRDFAAIVAHRARVRDLASVLAEQRIDVLYDRTYHMTLIAAEAARRRPTPRASVVVTDPALDFETNVERFRFAKRLLLARAYRTADRVVAVSAGVRTAAIERYRLDPQRVLTLHNMWDIERIDSLMHAALPAGEARSADGRFEIVAAGRLHRQKGFEFLLAALRELVYDRGLTQLHLRILGTGELESRLRQLIDEYQLQACVTLAGFRPNPLPYFRQADLFCLSSLYEGMPNALVEAMLCRVPIVATDCPSGPSEILAGGQFGRLVPPGDSHALADAIADACRNYPLWQSLLEPARAHIEQHFSPTVILPQLAGLLTSLATGPPR